MLLGGLAFIFLQNVFQQPVRFAVRREVFQVQIQHQIGIIFLIDGIGGFFHENRCGVLGVFHNGGISRFQIQICQIPVDPVFVDFFKVHLFAYEVGFLQSVLHIFVHIVLILV